VLLLHDNVHPCNVAQTAETLWKFKFDVTAHPLYSSDLTPSDYVTCLVHSKGALKGHQFTSDQEMMEVVHAWLTAQLKMLFSEGTRVPVQRWTKRIENQGHYVEKLC
jgi:hypothetical protein